MRRVSTSVVKRILLIIHKFVSNVPGDLCGRFENLCSQICENTDQSYVCKCNQGFILLEDKITCAPVVKNISENLINKDKEACPKGYIRELLTSACVDVDECDTGEATCDINTQICRNEVGGYKCVDVIAPSAADCKAGFRFNVGTESCEGRIYMTLYFLIGNRPIFISVAWEFALKMEMKS